MVIDLAAADDHSIPSATTLWRRIPYWHWVPDSVGGRRVSSAAFDEEDMSVVIADECTGGIDTFLRGHEHFGVAGFLVRDVREIGWGVVRVPDDSLPGHAHVTGKKQRGGCRNLAKKCEIVRPPDDAAADGTV